MARCLAEPALAGPVEAALFGEAEHAGYLTQVEPGLGQIADCLSATLLIDDVLTSDAVLGQTSLQCPRMHRQLVGDRLGRALAYGEQAPAQRSDVRGDPGVMRKDFAVQIPGRDPVGLLIRGVDRLPRKGDGDTEPVPDLTEEDGAAEGLLVRGIRPDLLVRQQNHAEMRVVAGQQPDDPGKVGHAQLVALAKLGHAGFGDLIGEDEILSWLVGFDPKLERRGVGVEIAGDSGQGLRDGPLVPGDHGDRSEDIETLPAGQAEAEVETTQLLGCRLRQLRCRPEGHERIRVPADVTWQVEAVQEPVRIAAELSHQIGVSPKVRGSDQAAHALTALSGQAKNVSFEAKTSACAVSHPRFMSTQHFDVLIIGAGLSGIGTACQITNQHPGKSIAVLERRERLGGTWDLFKYPGIRSDSDMFTFGYEFRPWHDLKVLADGASIRQYIADTATEYGIDRKIHYGLKIVSADWSSNKSQWTLTALHESTGETRTFTCGFLVSCTGYYNYDAGYLPNFPGVDQFQGECVHPQHWPEDLDYTGKKVVVIGSGATAVTLVPSMAGKTGHITMLQRSPSYVFSVPALDKISKVLGRVLPDKLVYGFARQRNIAIQRGLYIACRRWPKAMRRFLLSQVRRKVGPSVDMAHFTPSYMPWDERLCAVPDGDLFEALKSGEASIVTDRIETFTGNGIRLVSGQELEADIIITATGLQVQMLGGMQLSVDGEARELHDQMTYKGVLVEDIPNLAWIFGYTNAPWTLKSDIAGKYLCRLFKLMDDKGHLVATPRDADDSAMDMGMLDTLQSGYVQRAKDTLPRQGSKNPWKVLMHYGQDSRMLLEDPVDDGLLEFGALELSEAVA